MTIQIGVKRRRSSIREEIIMWSNSRWPSGYTLSVAAGDGRPSARGVRGGGVKVASITA